MIDIITEVIRHSVFVTGFVFVMMLLIDYLNVISRGMLSDRLKSSPFMQVLVATVLGVIPGCSGTFAVVSLYSHKLLSFGALVAALIATSGDESFVMIATMPRSAMWIFIISAVIAVITGLLVNKFYPVFYKPKGKFVPFEYHAHSSDKHSSLSFKNFEMTWRRVVVLSVFVLLILFSFTGEHEDSAGIVGGNIMKMADHGWVNVALFIMSVLSFILVAFSNEHFFREHIWEHTVKKHILKIFLWTFSALLVISLLMQFADVNKWVSENMYLILLIAVLVGLIPESGPHLIFVSMYLSGVIPFGVLLANSIVQDGHGALPLFAESPRDFVFAKGINLIVGLLAGGVSLLIFM